MPHLNDKIDFTTEVFVVYKNKVLLRKHDKYKTWLAVGGHIDPGEDPVEAGIREVKEEVGLDVIISNNDPADKYSAYGWKMLPCPEGVHRHDITDTHEHVTFVYFAKADTDQIKLSETEVTDDCRWFSLEDIKKDTEIKDEIKYFAKNALGNLS